MNVRWDVVVDRNAADSCAAPPLDARSRPPRGAGPVAASRIPVRVELFGALAALGGPRSFALDLPAGATVGDALATLGQRLGETFIAHVLDDAGAKRRYCRLFVGGYPVEDLHMPLVATSGPTEIDIILLFAPEGG